MASKWKSSTPCEDRSDPSDFQECEACSSKLGQPKLCASCLSNRSLIARLREEISLDDGLLAARKKFILELSELVGECKTHGPDCMPRVTDAVKDLAARTGLDDFVQTRPWRSVGAPPIRRTKGHEKRASYRTDVFTTDRGSVEVDVYGLKPQEADLITAIELAYFLVDVHGMEQGEARDTAARRVASAEELWPGRVAAVACCTHSVDRKES